MMVVVAINLRLLWYITNKNMDGKIEPISFRDKGDMIIFHHFIFIELKQIALDIV